MSIKRETEKSSQVRFDVGHTANTFVEEEERQSEGAVLKKKHEEL